MANAWVSQRCLSWLAELHQNETITTHATKSEPIVSHSPSQNETIATLTTKSEPIVAHSPFPFETNGPRSSHQIKWGFKPACLALFSSFCAYEKSKMAVSVHSLQADVKQPVSIFSTFVDSFHWVNTLYDGKVNCFQLSRCLVKHQMRLLLTSKLFNNQIIMTLLKQRLLMLMIMRHVSIGWHQNCHEYLVF